MPEVEAPQEERMRFVRYSESNKSNKGENNENQMNARENCFRPDCNCTADGLRRCFVQRQPRDRFAFDQ